MTANKIDLSVFSDVLGVPVEKLVIVPVEFEASCVPETIYKVVEKEWQPGYHLLRLDTDGNSEWWLLDAESDLIDVYWIE